MLSALIFLNIILFLRGAGNERATFDFGLYLQCNSFNDVLSMKKVRKNGVCVFKYEDNVKELA